MKHLYNRTSASLLIIGALVTSFITPLVFQSKVSADTLGAMTTVATNTIAYKGLVEGSDGRLWYGGDWGSISATTKSGVKTDYSVSGTNNYHVDDMVRGADGNVWYTYDRSVQKITPSGVISSYNLPATTGTNLNSWRPTHVTSGPDGNIWVASYTSYTNSTANAYAIHVFSTSGNYIKSYDSTGNIYGLAPNYQDNSVWYARRNESPTGATYSLIKLSLESNSSTVYTVPSATGNIGDLVYGNDGSMWLSYTNSASSGGFFKVTNAGSFTGYAPPTSGIYYISPGLDGNAWMTSYQNGYIFRLTQSGTYTLYSTASPNAITAGSDGNMWFTRQGDKIAKIGTGVSSSTIDSDNDGLNASQEFTQGTSDLLQDSDRDGLSDYTESSSFPNRNSLFCNSAQSYCEYPSPSQKDLYVEIDWMSKPTDQGYSSNAYETKPSSAQLNAIKSSYANKGILAHFDTGQLGGGNEVPFQQVVRFEETANAPDFYNYKHGGDGLQANFNPNRYQIYHYMLSGYQYQDLDKSGASRAGDDDVFIAYGALRDSPITINLDNTISGVVMHELGHNLCLTDLNPKNGGTPYYPSQPASCRFAGIDSYSGNPYPSVMNYSKQHSGLVDYSTGQGGQGDHDDWGAIRLYDFANQTMGDPQTNPSTYRMNSYSRTTDKNRVPDSVIHGQTIKRLR